MSIKADKTYVKTSDSFTWSKMPNHLELYHKEILSTTDADMLGLKASSILWEKIGVGGAVLPHYHDVAEIIHITVGKVKLLCNGKWESYSSGETFLVPAGIIHSVVNEDTVPTEQISIFLPVSNDNPPNQPFNTYMVENTLTKK